MINYLRTQGLLGCLRLFRDFLITKLCFPGARLVRYPWYIRGRGRMCFGSGLTTGVGLRLDAWGSGNSPCLFIGRNVQMNDYVHIGAMERVEIGDNVLIASRVLIIDHEHGRYDMPDCTSNPKVPPIKRPLISRPVAVGANVWIGDNVCILPGVTIGEGAIIGAGAVVTGNIPPRSIAVGNPARCIRQFDENNNQWMFT